MYVPRKSTKVFKPQLFQELNLLFLLGILKRIGQREGRRPIIRIGFFGQKIFQPSKKFLLIKSLGFGRGP